MSNLIVNRRIEYSIRDEDSNDLLATIDINSKDDSIDINFMASTETKHVHLQVLQKLSDILKGIGETL